MPERNDMRAADDFGIAFAMYCDTNGLTGTEVQRLAEDVIHSIEGAAEHCIEDREQRAGAA